MSNKSIATVATMGIDIGKNSFHVVGRCPASAIASASRNAVGRIRCVQDES